MKDKIAFVIAFLGVFIALTPFKDNLISIQLDYIYLNSVVIEWNKS